MDKYKALAHRLGELTNSEFLLANRIFEDIEGAADILYEIRSARVDVDAFLRICLAARKLAHASVEGNLIRTAILISPPDGNVISLPVSQELSSDFFLKEPNFIAQEAIRVDGRTRSFIVESGGSENLPTRVVKLDAVGSEQQQSIVNPEWGKLCMATRGSGCGFALPGNQRVKLLVNGDQIAEYRQGVWKQLDFCRLFTATRAAIDEDVLRSTILRSVLRVCAVASDIGKGLIIIIGTAATGADLLARCSGVIKIDADDRYAELRTKPITAFAPDDYLSMIAGDNAVILGSDGIIIALNAHLLVSQKGGVAPIPGTHARHLSAQLFSRDTKTLAIVVSMDGPITVFNSGDVVVRIA